MQDLGGDLKSAVYVWYMASEFVILKSWSFNSPSFAYGLPFLELRHVSAYSLETGSLRRGFWPANRVADGHTRESV